MTALDALWNGAATSTRVGVGVAAAVVLVVGFLADLPALLFVGFVLFWVSVWWAIRGRASRGGDA